MSRPLVVAALLAALFIHRSAQAAEPASPITKVAAKDAATPAATSTSNAEGMVLRLGTGLLIPAGRFADAKGLEMSEFGVGETFHVQLGHFVSPHVAVVAGFRGSFDHRGVSDCKPSTKSKSDCSGLTYQIPVLVEYVQSHRKYGFYTQAGLGLFTRYNFQASDVAAEFSNDIFEFKGAVGYRIGNPKSDWSVDMNLGLDVGQFTDVSVHSSTLSMDSSPIDKKAYHETLTLNATFQFAL